jgi:hypothetical protein
MSLFVDLVVAKAANARWLAELICECDFLNKRHKTFLQISSVFGKLAQDGVDIARVWAQIDAVIVKTLLAAGCTMQHSYKAYFPYSTPSRSACFEILGFDIMLDADFRPWVLEVNHSPSFVCDEQIDKDVKEAVIGQALTLMRLSAALPRAPETLTPVLPVRKSSKDATKDSKNRPPRGSVASALSAAQVAAQVTELAAWEDTCCATNKCVVGWGLGMVGVHL